ncbi:unnamed protein product [Amoebophrya sp. A120]|nr:unnamed protein product [Amoebophrya sp. A120]|eukprot:GSA120T00019781001.1
MADQPKNETPPTSASDAAATPVSRTDSEKAAPTLLEASQKVPAGATTGAAAQGGDDVGKTSSVSGKQESSSASAAVTKSQESEQGGATADERQEPETADSTAPKKVTVVLVADSSAEVGGEQPTAAEGDGDTEVGVENTTTPSGAKDQENGDEGQDEETQESFALRTKSSYERELLGDKSLVRYDVSNTYDFAPFEIADFARGYHLVDVLGDEILGERGIIRVLEIIGQQAESEFVFQTALNKTDPEGKGIWNFQSFVDIMALFRKPPLTETDLRETFDLMDRDKGGTISAGELRTMMTCVGESLTTEEAEDMVALADADCSGEIDFQEFRSFVLSGAV